MSLRLTLDKWDLMESKIVKDFSKIRQNGILSKEERTELAGMIKRPSHMVQRLYKILSTSAKLNPSQRACTRYLMFYVNNDQEFGKAADKQKADFLGYCIKAFNGETGQPLEVMHSMKDLANPNEGSLMKMYMAPATQRNSDWQYRVNSWIT